MGLEEIWAGTTSTLEAIGMNDLSSGWFKDLKVSLIYWNSFLWSCDSSWRNWMVSCVCHKCHERSTRVSLLMCTMSSSLEMIKLWRMFKNWICCTIWTWSLEIRLSCCKCCAMNCFTWFCYLHGLLAMGLEWHAHLTCCLLHLLGTLARVVEFYCLNSGIHAHLIMIVFAWMLTCLNWWLLAHLKE